jgi:hypothetical protein
VFNPQDEESLRRMLGAETGELPAFLEQEYQTRLRLFHKGGGSGPLGALGLTDLCRSLKLAPPKQEEPVRLDLQKLKPGSPVKIRIRGEWERATYVGRGGDGKAAVRTEDGITREWRNSPDVFRIEHEDYVEAPACVLVVDPQGEPVVFTKASPSESLEGLGTAFDEIIPVGTIDMTDQEIVQAAEAALADPVAVTESFDGTDDAEPPADYEHGINWADRAPGESVWADGPDGSITEGKLHHTDEAGNVYVLPDGDFTEPVAFANANVYPA